MIELLLIAFLLGVKHSYDPDHLAAVANFILKTESVEGAVKLSVYWALGHMITAGIITALLYTFRETILQSFLGYFGIAVSIMLIGIGIYSLRDAIRVHRHSHSHGKAEHEHFHVHLRGEKGNHYHKHLFGVGIIHGLASNDELLLLFTLSLGITKLTGILAGGLVFSAGVVVGMSLFGAAMITPLLKLQSEKVWNYVNFGSGGLSLAYGLYLLSAFFY